MTSGQDIWNFNASKGNCRCDGCNKEDEHRHARESQWTPNFLADTCRALWGKMKDLWFIMVCLNIAQPQAPICTNMISYSHWFTHSAPQGTGKSRQPVTWEEWIQCCNVMFICSSRFSAPFQIAICTHCNRWCYQTMGFELESWQELQVIEIDLDERNNASECTYQCKHRPECKGFEGSLGCKSQSWHFTFRIFIWMRQDHTFSLPTRLLIVSHVELGRAGLGCPWKRPTWTFRSLGLTSSQLRQPRYYEHDNFRCQLFRTMCWTCCFAYHSRHVEVPNCFAICQVWVKGWDTSKSSKRLDSLLLQPGEYDPFLLAASCGFTEFFRRIVRDEDFPELFLTGDGQGDPSALNSLWFIECRAPNHSIPFPHWEKKRPC